MAPPAAHAQGDGARPPPSLSPEQVAQFERDGFLVVPDFVSPADVAAMRARGLALLNAFDPSSPGAKSVFSSSNQFRVSTSYFLESASTAAYFLEEGAFDADGKLTAPPEKCVNKIAHALHDVDPAFRKWARSPAVAGLASALGFAKPLPVQSMYICKQPGIGGEVVPHQDSTFLATDPPSTVGVWVALEDADENNGCLWALPGSHRAGVLRRFGRGLGEDGAGEKEGGEQGAGAGAAPSASTRWYEGGSGGATTTTPSATTPPVPHVGFDRPAPSYDLSAGVPLPAPAGTLVLLHGAVLHWSAPNTGSASRHAFTVHIAEGGKGCVWRGDNWLQRPADAPFEPLYDAEGVGVVAGGGGGGDVEGGVAAVTA